jgi:hypothetical protein
MDTLIAIATSASDAKTSSEPADRSDSAVERNAARAGTRSPGLSSRDASIMAVSVESGVETIMVRARATPARRGVSGLAASPCTPRKPSFHMFAMVAAFSSITVHSIPLAASSPLGLRPTGPYPTTTAWSAGSAGSGPSSFATRVRGLSQRVAGP